MRPLSRFRRSRFAATRRTSRGRRRDHPDGDDEAELIRARPWSADGPVASWYDALEVWRGWADDVRGGPIACGHFLPEEAPGETARELGAFFAPAC
jgi:hypothetical protein